MGVNHESRFSHLFGVRHPIIQAPMAGATTPELAAAVSNSNALGSLGLGSSSVDQARHQIRTLRQLTDKPFNVNFFCHQPPRTQEDKVQAWIQHLRPYFEANDADVPSTLESIYPPIDANDAMVAMINAEQPHVVSFHFGVPKADIIRSIQAYGGRVLVSVTTLQEGYAAEASGVDAVIAQGIEAGGHRGCFDAQKDEAIGLTSLLQVLVSHLNIPIIAAGGIMDGRGINGTLALGALGAQLGTAFLLCPESNTGSEHRALLKSDAAVSTSVTRAISGRPARGITGVFQRQIEPTDMDRIPDYPIAYDAARQLNTAAKSNNNLAFSPNWAGQSAIMCRELPASELVSQLVNEMT
ncbi:nitronate monooxygenase [Salinisphaera sp. USBA-960]|nr:nitronate monooxygenase [Salifodinibacter halophilus]NNC26283.1 nitronate monooxygenase [Salifodinibacter halophilus]